VARLLPVYRQRAVLYSDELAAYRAVLPAKRHRPSRKGSGQTNHLECLNATLRARCARLVRQTLAFSKSLTHLIGAVWLYIHDCNQRIRAVKT
jgi:insertion element IS1 protein InsB